MTQDISRIVSWVREIWLYWAKLINAIVIRLWSSALFVTILYLGSRHADAEATAAFISLNAIFYISAAAGKLGADGLATYNSVSFRMARSAKARSLYYSTLALVLCAVPLSALLIVVAIRLVSGKSLHLGSDWQIILGSSAFAFCQFQAAILQAQKNTARSSLVFLVIPYAFVLASLWLPRPLHPIWMVLGLVVSCLIGHYWIALRFSGNRLVLSNRWIRKGLVYYTIGLNYYIAEWGVQLISATFLPSAGAVIFGLGTRLSSLLAVPVNASTGYLQPIFAVHMRRREKAQIWNIYRRVVSLTMFSQAVAVIIGCAVVWFLPVASSKFGSVISETGWNVLLILVAGQIFNGMTGPSGIILVMMQNSRLFVIVTTGFTVLTIAIGVYATIDHGLVALAWAITGIIISRKVVECAILYLYLRTRLH
jgi:O-antigen/teichoic acid export membrane protein